MAKTAEEPAPIISGFCASPATDDPAASHQRCADKGAGSRANPGKVFHPCPCPCHLAHEAWDSDTQNPDGTFGPVMTYECGGCGGMIAEAPVLGLDEDGDPIYVHVDKHTGRMLYQACR